MNHLLKAGTKRKLGPKAKNGTYPQLRDDALDAEKTYHFRARQLSNEVRSLWDEYGGYYARGKIEKVFPVPPRLKWLGAIPTDILSDKPELITSQQKRYLGY